ncbi:hypothetical protein CC78DRAFT_569549 [Lojkania enalia]|uniref:Telomere-associated protein Rif1 N-terminal domain-containing protein n=1 Tax=Lojkania enalia TaxID=147567 RepID=A0A9P4K5W6_9PLEO|nr:hypothetical protein CC78DRAFT_569549 [Didymosphaeria enalia]
MVFSTSKFESFSIRPPTPPKEIKDLANDADEALEFMSDPFGTESELPKVATTLASAKSLLNTPEQSPSSETGGSTNSDRRRKRVNFELPICIIPDNGLAARPWTPLRSSPLRPLPQTRVSKPLKSILKAYDPTSTPPPIEEGVAAHKFQTFAEMLESIVKMLAQGSRPSKLDAYISLQRTMQAYDRVPDIQSLQDKMGLLSQFIRRDMQAASLIGTGSDSQLISQALKLLMALVRIPELRSSMDDEFCSSVIDRVIQVAADTNIPKTIINTHLALLMQQNFRPRTMTTARVEKVLDILDDIHKRVSGYSVLAYRIRIYKKLIQQSPDLMARHTERWFKHTVNAMLSMQKDINQSALETTICAAKTIGTNTQLTKAVLSVLNRVKDDGETFAKLIAQELDKMLSTENAALAPQIWAAITALMRGSLSSNQFPSIQDWLLLLENFFNSEHELVKVHASVAMNFLIYAVNMTLSTPTVWSKMLSKILQDQLQQRSQWKKSQGGAATSGYFTLLYYSLRPVAPLEQLDRYWTEFVADFWIPLIHSHSPKHSVAACRVVSGLLNGSRKPWNEQRALELKSHLMVQREELPLLDPRWVRKSLSSILKFVEPLLDATPWAPDAGEDESVKLMWIALLDSLVEAKSKEVVASTDTKDAVAHLVNLLRRVWDRHTAKLAMTQHKEDSWADKFCFLVETIIQKLGAFQFADKCLTRNGNDEFEAATPSHRYRGPRLSPLLYFIELLIGRSEGKLSDAVRLRVVKLMMEPCLDAQNSRLSKLEMLKGCSVAVEPSATTAVMTDFWNQIAALVNLCIHEQPSDSNERSLNQLGNEYDIVVDILALGSPHLLDTTYGHDLLTAFTETARREAGEGAVVLAVIEKVSERVLNMVPEKDGNACLAFISVLLKNIPKNIDRRILEQTRHKLSPSSPTLARNSEFDPYSHFYQAIVTTGTRLYISLMVQDYEKIKDFLCALTSSIHEYPTSLLTTYLRRIQSSITPWIEDPDRKMQKKDQYLKQIYREVLALWETICEAIGRLPRKDSSLLSALEHLIASGLSSRRWEIVKVTVATWNVTFGKEDSLQYPPRVEKAVQKLRGTVDLSLPSLLANEDYDSGLSFYESDSSDSNTRRRAQGSHIRDMPMPVDKPSRQSRSPAVSSAGRKKPSSRKVKGVRLRHEDSQINFEPVYSSLSNPFEQELQMLTERQQRMIEKQRQATIMFRDIGASRTSQPTPTASRSPALEPQSDALSADDLPTENSRIPLQALASIGPMDVYLGSSPTPNARRRSRQILSDDTSLATPNAVRTIQLTNETEDIGSSPPQFEKQSTQSAGNVVSDSFSYRQPENPTPPSENSESMEEECLPESNHMKRVGVAEASGDELSEVASSTVELQLTAQFNAELNAGSNSTAEKQPPRGGKALRESHNIFVDESSQQSVLHTMDGDAEMNELPPMSNSEVQKTQLPCPNTDVNDDSGNSLMDASCIEDSFSKSPPQQKSAAVSTPQVGGLRRSLRTLATSIPSGPASSKKRKQPPVDSERNYKKSKKVEHIKVEELSPILKLTQEEDENISDCIVVEQPKKKGRGRPSRSKSKKKSRDDSLQGVPNGLIVIPETTQKRSVRRSASSFGQVETPSETVIEDMPARKRAKTKATQDVSEAKTTPSESSELSQIKRATHVQVSPRRSSFLSIRGSSTVPDHEGTTIDPDPSESMPLSGTEQKLNTALQLRSNAVTPIVSEQRQSQQATTAVTTPSRSFTERVILTPRSVLEKLRSIKRMLSELPQMVLGRQEEREFDDTLFDIRREVHAAARRGEEGL